VTVFYPQIRANLESPDLEQWGERFEKLAAETRETDPRGIIGMMDALSEVALEMYDEGLAPLATSTLDRKRRRGRVQDRKRRRGRRQGKKVVKVVGATRSRAWDLPLNPGAKAGLWGAVTATVEEAKDTQGYSGARRQIEGNTEGVWGTRGHLQAYASAQMYGAGHVPARLPVLKTPDSMESFRDKLRDIAGDWWFRKLEAAEFPPEVIRAIFAGTELEDRF
jgi:hypothetical protein